MVEQETIQTEFWRQEDKQTSGNQIDKPKEAKSDTNSRENQLKIHKNFQELMKLFESGDGGVKRILI